jgi:hypothetical protein
MEMDNSMQSTLNQLVALQQQQLNTMQSMNQKQNLPNANFMSNYANYAPNYMPPMFPMTPSAQIAQDNFRTFGNQLSGGNRYGFMDTVFLDKSRYSNESRNMMAADYGSRVGNAALAGGSALAQGAFSLGVDAFMPGIAGMAAGAIGGAVIGGLFDIGLQQNQQQQAYNKYLMRESYRFINPSESTNERDITGFSTAQRHEASTYLRHFNTENRITDQETMMLLQKYTEGGLLKEVNDLKTFQSKMKQLTDSVKTSALILNETFDSISNLMADMQKSGIDLKNFDYLTAKGKLVGGQLGISGSEALRGMVNIGGNMVANTAYDINNATGRAGDNMAYVNQLYDRGKATNDTNYRIISNYGGVEQASGMMAQMQGQFLSSGNMANASAAMFNYNPDTKKWEFDKNAYNNVISGKYSVQDMYNMASQKFSNNPAGYMDWKNNADMYIQNSMNFDQMSGYTLSMMDAYRKMNPEIYGQMSSDTLLQQMGMGGDKNLRLLYANELDYYKQDGGSLRRRLDMQAKQQQIISGANAQRPGFKYEISNWWEGVKDNIGDAFAPVGDWFSDRSQDISDWWYGKQYSSLRVSKQRDFSLTGLENQGKEVSTALIDGIKKGLEDAKSKGYTVSDSLVKLLSDSIDEIGQGNKAGLISYKRTVYNSTNGLDEETKRNYGTIQSVSSKYDLSETIVAALMKYGNQTGSTMGMTGDTVSEISKKLNLKVNGLDTSGQIDAAGKYMNRLMAAYGGNEQFALAAYGSSQADLDAKLLAMGIDIEGIRKDGNWNKLNDVPLNKILSSMVNNYVTDVTNNIPGSGGDKLPSGSSSFTPGSKGAITQIYSDQIIQNAKHYGLDANVLATLLASGNASGNAGLVTNGDNNSVNVGLGQLNSATAITELMKSGFETSTGISFKGKTLNEAIEMLQNPDTNLEATSAWWQQNLSNAGGNQYWE